MNARTRFCSLFIASLGAVLLASATGIANEKKAGKKWDALILREVRGLYRLLQLFEIPRKDYWLLVSQGRELRFSDPLAIPAITRFLRQSGLSEDRAVNEAMEITWVLLSEQDCGRPALAALRRKGLLGNRISLVARGEGRYVYSMSIYKRVGCNYSKKGLPAGWLIRTEQVLVDLRADFVTVTGGSEVIITDEGKIHQKKEQMFNEMLSADEPVEIRIRDFCVKWPD
jgi:hypothetical protein